MNGVMRSVLTQHANSQACCVLYNTSRHVQVLVQEQPTQWYHFLTTLCAIIGGVFTVAGILDSISFSAVKMMKKVELGKHS